MKALLLSAYDARSHAYWREVLYTSFPDIEWVTLTLSPRHFQWRIRGNPLAWYQDPRLQERYDFCVATSMVDLSTLRGIVPRLASVPTLLYFHENQFAYPYSDKVPSAAQVQPQMVQLYSALSAEALCFNSEFNRASFFKGAEQLLKRLPDGAPPSISSELRSRSQVVPVPLKMFEKGVSQERSNAKTRLVWNHRWEYDKGPERLLAFVQALPEGLALEFHVLGQCFRQVPECMEVLRGTLIERGWLGRWGYIEDDSEYHGLLSSADYVLSTALHDFQGLSVMEAVRRGCIPILPTRMVYPEYFQDQYLYTCHESIDDEAREMVSTFLSLLEHPSSPPPMGMFDADELVPAYSALFDGLCALP